MKRKRKHRRPSRRTIRILLAISAVVVILVGLKLGRQLKGNDVVHFEAKHHAQPDDAAGRPVAVVNSGDLGLLYNSQDLSPSEGQVLRNIKENTQIVGNTGLKMALPSNMVFNQVKLGKGIEASYGYDTNSNVGMTMVSHKAVLGSEEVLSTIKINANTAGIPNVMGVDFNSFGNAQKITAITGSGLGDASLWRGKNSKGDDIFVGYAPRLDKQGVYIIIMSGPNAYFEDNEGYLDNLYSQMQVAPNRDDNSTTAH